MKTLFALLFSLSAFAQATFTLPGVAGEPNLSVTVSADAVTNLTAFLGVLAPTSGWPNSAGIPADSTLSSGVNASTTSIPLASASNLRMCNGLLIESEIMAVVSVSGNTVTVIRAGLGTSGVTHAQGAAVKVLRFGNYTCFLKGAWADTIANVVTQKLQGTFLQAQQAAIAAAQANVAASAAAAVQ